ncbi:Zn(II)2Cys6 transcription factor domain-containing protein [Aspergillus homomorphus CBS 101889]|uniref:Zn(2)-C6 fungal-type domain-containing protein n=1 Tax=Aspergillus homomorphus (strain CBS 101889) TaxID=1450537 RepID=A0A395I449_ASPHC|nr:hypothetical protein BO97DRAFT_468943 [Aspergillus homomorphus CBS 101889]RAL14509.1 hypothetical protein BO97DRAFT_468943 [Aspergillus homomorphus CBS 101889]
MDPKAEKRHQETDSNQCLPPPPSQPTADGDFRCGICNKTYSRRDLRDRHRRRCIKNIGQERQSKRKSCDTCAQKKLRCSMTRPSCSRCLQSRRPCVYPASCVPVTPPEPVMTQDNSDLAITSPLDSLYIPLTLAPSNGPWTLSAPPLDTTSTYDDTSRPSWSPANSSNVGLLAHSHGDSTVFATQGHWPYESSSGSDYLSQQPDSYRLNDHLPGLIDDYFGHQSQLQYNSQHGTTASSPAAMMPPTPAAFSGDGYSLSNGFTMASLSSAYTEYAWSEGISTYDDDELLPFAACPETVPGNMFGHSSMAKGGDVSDSIAGDVIHDMVSLLREYPGIALQQKSCSPFLHPELHASAMQTLREPPENSLAILSAYVTYVESHERANGGIRDFDGFRRGLQSCITPLHTLCVYQILDLFDDNYLPNMLIHRLQVAYGGILRASHEEETDWTRWKFSESLRRNIYFVHIIHTIAAKAHLHRPSSNGQVCAYPLLQDETLLQLPLPAPEEMWLARSEEEWMLARAQFLRSWTGTLDGNMLPIPRTLQQWLLLEEVGSTNVSSLPPITRMILACIRANNDLTSLS